MFAGVAFAHLICIIPTQLRAPWALAELVIVYSMLEGQGLMYIIHPEGEGLSVHVD